jgi:hypothetical protein
MISFTTQGILMKKKWLPILTTCMLLVSVSSTWASAGTSSKWSKPERIDNNSSASQIGTSSISCTLLALCIAVFSDGDEVASIANKWETPLKDVWAGTSTFVSCPTSSFCLEMDNYGDTSAYDPGTKVDEWNFPDRGTNVNIASLACASSAFCVAVGSGGAAWIYSEKKWSAASEISPRIGLTSVSCGGLEFCVAVDAKGAAFIFAAGKWIGPEKVDSGSAASGGLTSVSCASKSFCMAVGSNGDAVRYSLGKWSHPKFVDTLSGQSGTGGFTSVSCLFDSFCMAVDSNGAAMSYESGKWSDPTVIDRSSATNYGYGLTSVSCSQFFCVAIDNDGNALTYRIGA